MSRLAPCTLGRVLERDKLQLLVSLWGAWALAPLEAYDLRECRYVSKDPSNRAKHHSDLQNIIIVQHCVVAGEAGLLMHQHLHGAHCLKGLPRNIADSVQRTLQARCSMFASKRS